MKERKDDELKRLEQNIKDITRQLRGNGSVSVTTESERRPSRREEAPKKLEVA